MTKIYVKALIGRKIVDIKWLTDKEADQLGFDMGNNPVQKILLDDGTFLTALQDPEGNGPGFIIQASSGGICWDIEPKD